MAELQRENTIEDKPIKMGYRSGGTQGITVPATNGDYYHRLGGAFVKIVAGVARLCATVTASVDGWLCMNKETSKNNALAGSGKAHFVITDTSAIFEIPTIQAKASFVGASYIGRACRFITRGSTTSQKQYAFTGPKCATPLLLIRDIDKVNKTVFVSINPNKLDVSQ